MGMVRALDRPAKTMKRNCEMTTLRRGFIGLALSIAVMHLATSFLFGLSPEDPATIGGALLLLLMVSMAAGFFPAWRAASVDPMQALRTE